MIWGSIAARRERYFSAKGLKTPFWTWEIIVSLLVFAIVSGLRYNVGVDYLAYLHNYQHYQIFNEFTLNKEPGFEFITKTLALCNLHFTFYFGLLAFLQIFFIYYAVRKERYLLPFIGFLIIMGPHYLSWMNGIRQMLAATIFVFSIEFIKNRKLLPYIIVLLIASSIHRSAMLLIIFYFIPQKDYFKNRYINIAIVLITLFIGLNPTWITKINGASNFLSLIGYDRYAERFDIILELKEPRVFGPRQIIILLLNIITLWHAPKLKSVFRKTNFLIYFNLAFIGILYSNLFINTNHIFLRPVSYLTIFLILTTAYLLYYLSKEKTRIKKSQFWFIILISVVFMSATMMASSGKGNHDFSNYKFYWDYVDR